MFGRHPDGRIEARQVLLVLVPVLVGVLGLVLLTGNRSTPSRVETQGTVVPSPLAVEAPGPVVPATAPPVPGGSEGTPSFSSPGTGSPSTVVPGAPSAAEAAPARSTSGVGGGAEGGVDGGAPGPAASPPPSGRASGGLDEPSTSTVPPDSTTSTTLAPSTTTTTAPPPRSTSPARAPSAEAEVVPLTNADRAAENLGPLNRNSCLDGVASRYAEQMARSGVLAHNPGAETAIRGCRPGAAWGDNVGTSAPCDIALIEEKWMASPTHRKNILTGAFQLMGIGAWTDGQGGCWVQVVFSS